MAIPRIITLPVKVTVDGLVLSEDMEESIRRVVREEIAAIALKAYNRASGEPVEQALWLLSDAASPLF